MAKVVALNGARPTGWARDRWSWMGAAMASQDLTQSAKLIAVALAQGFSNHETAECRPGVQALIGKTGLSRRAVMYALSDLCSAGWLERNGGEAPGRAAAYRFRWPSDPRKRPAERVQEAAPERVQEAAPERVQEAAPERVQDLTPTGANSCTPPIPPYKDEPNMNQKSRPEKPVHPRVAIRGMQRPQTLTHVIAPGSGRAERWNEWLEAHGYPPLERIGFMSEGGYRMPVSIAPSPEHETPYRIAIRWADWLRSRG